MTVTAKSLKRNADSITQRLRSLTEEFSVNEVARRTETPESNVHRYIRGAKIPADFCGRLVQEFHVNPAWLLTGEHTSNKSSQGVRGEMAGDLLGMVQAMNSVTHVRVGALSGKHHEKVARELSDALRRCEDLRGRVGEHAKSVYTHIAGQLEEAMDKLDVDIADELMLAAEQIERLCFDDEVSSRHLELMTRLSILRYQFDSAYEYQRRLFCKPLGDAELDSDEFCIGAIRLTKILEFAGDNSKALKVAQVAMLLCEGNESKLFGYPMLASTAGALMVQDGKLFHGLQLQQRWVGKISSEIPRNAMSHKLMISMLFAGAMPPEDAFEWGDRGHIKALDMLNIALLRCEPKLLELAINYYHDLKTPKHKVYERWKHSVLYAEAALAALRGRRKIAMAKSSKAASSAPKRAKPVFDALFHRAMNDKKRLVTAVEVSVERLSNDSLPLPLFLAAIHHKNVLESGIRSADTEAFIGKYSEYILFPF